ncbi:MAG: carbon monoxide dehydrogenase [Dehalococcoidia bacterium CG2_30_46_19]|nr:MAG: carbon monoxide dehydrogenase [Dehalococcoidia bacterium CG2_30_46_19]
MKIAVSGKGGVGKTLLVAFLSTVFAKSGYSVLAIDADPNVNLAVTFGFPNSQKIIPISKMDDLIEERTGARPGQMAPYFRLNPKVDDLPEKCSLKYDGIRIMVMGPIKAAGSGCYCPEGALLQALIAHLLLEVDEVVILDMEAGIEHLTRGTAKGVDKLIIVVEPSRRSVETGYRVRDLALEIGVKNIGVVANKIRNEREKDFLISSMPDFEFLGFIPYDQGIIEADLAGSPLVNSSPKVMNEVKNIAAQLDKLK